MQVPKGGHICLGGSFHEKSGNQWQLQSQTQRPQIYNDVDGLGYVIGKGRPAKSQTEKHNKLWHLICFGKLKFKKEDMNK